MLILAAITLFLWLALATDWLLGVRRTPHLRPGPAPAEPPLVSVVIPARNEARALAASLASVLAQDYPRLEVIVLNDRSTDDTGEILERLGAAHPQLQVIHLRELPAGWLGKNHALHRGAQAARGAWLLFTDADVHFHPQTVSAAVAYARAHRLDHLTALPHLLARSPLLKAFVSAFGLLFSFGVLRASAPATKAYVGLGAFNLLKRSVYEQLGGHRPIALRPDDDMRLGKLVLDAGFSQRAVFATELLRVEWYTSVAEAVRGLNKNAFAGCGYALPVVFAVTLALFVTHALPFVAVFTTTGVTQLLYTLVLAVIVGVYAVNGRVSGLPVWYAALHGLGTLILIYAILESAAKATLEGGIRWRGTFYSLEQLRRG